MPDRPGDTERTAVAALEAAFAASRQDIEALRLELRASEEGRAEAEGRAAVLAAQVEAEQQTSDARTHNLAKALARERERADRAEAVAAVVPELRERVGRAEGESATLRERMESERARAAAAEAELEKARIGRAAAEAGMKGLQEALAEARRPWWRKALGR